MDQNFGIFLLLSIVAGPILYGLMKVSATSPGRALQNKFVSLGNLAGRTKNEIFEVVGSPSAISAISEGSELLQWQATGYHIALRFNGDICEGITHQSVTS